MTPVTLEMCLCCRQMCQYFREVTGQFYEANASNMIPKRLYLIKEFCFKMQS